jgi:hypothetical protein
MTGEWPPIVVEGGASLLGERPPIPVEGGGP